MSEQITVRTEPSNLFGLSTLDQALAFAGQMSKAKLLPAHLQNSPADCLRVVMQAARWGMDPFSVADKTSIISGKLMYEGQLVAAVVNARGKLSKRLSYDYKGEGTSRVLTVSGVLEGEETPRTIDLTHAQALKINRNGQMAANPDQQMAYIGSRIWARRHMPELMLGVYTPDEIDPEGEVNVTGTGEGEQPKIDRKPPPERSKKGAAAVKENAKTDTIEANATVVEEKKEEAPPAKEEPKAAPAPVALSDGQKVTAKVIIEQFTLSSPKVGGVPTPSVKATVSGEYAGIVWHIGGAKLDGDKLVPVSDAWQIERPVDLQLIGKLNKNSNTVTAAVESIKLHEEEEQF